MCEIKLIFRSYLRMNNKSENYEKMPVFFLTFLKNDFLMKYIYLQLWNRKLRNFTTSEEKIKTFFY